MLKILLLLFFFPAIMLGQSAETDHPQRKIDYWLKHHRLAAEPEKRSRMAQEVFRKLLAVADKPIGVLPKLYVFSDLKFGKLCALPDGSIILPDSVILFCARDPRQAEARLAFVLGHELKHVVRGDYAIEGILKFNSTISDSLEERRRKTLETEADEFGILYSSLAGYDVRAIIAPANSFISDYYRALKINYHGDAFNNSVKDRQQALNRRLGEIVEHLDLFDFGVRLYAIGKYDAAIELFEKFVSQYPSREVFNNLGLCYYQKAFGYYAKWKHAQRGKDPNLDFRVSAQIDPLSRFEKTRPMAANYEQLFQETIARAVKNFEEAKARDEKYEITLNNLGCAYLLQGNINYAMGSFDETIKRNPFCKEAQNDLGVACYIAGKPSEAATHFQAAHSRKVDFLEPLYNLGLLSWQTGRDDEAREYFKKYLQLDGTSVYAEVARKYLGMAASNNLPAAGGKINRPALAAISGLGKGRWNEFVTATVKVSIFHAAGQDTQFFQCLSKPAGEKIYMLLSTNNFRGGLEREISIRAPSSLVEARLPYSHAIKPSTQGAFWVYEELGLVFEMRNQKVHNWYWFEVR